MDEIKLEVYTDHTCNYLTQSAHHKKLSYNSLARHFYILLDITFIIRFYKGIQKFNWAIEFYCVIKLF